MEMSTFDNAMAELNRITEESVVATNAQFQTDQMWLTDSFADLWMMVSGNEAVPPMTLSPAVRASPAAAPPASPAVVPHDSPPMPLAVAEPQPVPASPAAEAAPSSPPAAESEEDKETLEDISKRLMKLRVVDLRKELAALGLPKKGRKAELVARLAEAQFEAENIVEEEEEEEEEEVGPPAEAEENMVEEEPVADVQPPQEAAAEEAPVGSSDIEMEAAEVVEEAAPSPQASPVKVSLATEDAPPAATPTSVAAAPATAAPTPTPAAAATPTPAPASHPATHSPNMESRKPSVGSAPPLPASPSPSPDVAAETSRMEAERQKLRDEVERLASDRRRREEARRQQGGMSGVPKAQATAPTPAPTVPTSTPTPTSTPAAEPQPIAVPPSPAAPSPVAPVLNTPWLTPSAPAAKPAAVSRTSPATAQQPPVVARAVSSGTVDTANTSTSSLNTTLSAPRRPAGVTPSSSGAGRVVPKTTSKLTGPQRVERKVPRKQENRPPVAVGVPPAAPTAGKPRPVLSHKADSTPGAAASNTPLPAASKPHTLSAPAGPVVDHTSYAISDHEGDTDSEAEDTAARTRKGKPIPEWAVGDALDAAVAAQQDASMLHAPDRIFGEVTTCDLEVVFGRLKKRYTRRTSSGNWVQDRLTEKEKQAYAKSIMQAR